MVCHLSQSFSYLPLDGANQADIIDVDLSKAWFLTSFFPGNAKQVHASLQSRRQIQVFCLSKSKESETVSANKLEHVSINIC